MYKEILEQAENFERHQSDFNQRIISHSERILEDNKIRLAISDILDEIEKYV